MQKEVVALFSYSSELLLILSHPRQRREQSLDSRHFMPGPTELICHSLQPVNPPRQTHNLSQRLIELANLGIEKVVVRIANVAAYSARANKFVFDRGSVVRQHSAE